MIPVTEHEEESFDADDHREEVAKNIEREREWLAEKVRRVRDSYPDDLTSLDELDETDDDDRWWVYCEECGIVDFDVLDEDWFGNWNAALWYAGYHGGTVHSESDYQRGIPVKKSDSSFLRTARRVIEEDHELLDALADPEQESKTADEVTITVPSVEFAYEAGIAIWGRGLDLHEDPTDENEEMARMLADIGIDLMDTYGPAVNNNDAPEDNPDETQG